MCSNAEAHQARPANGVSPPAYTFRVASAVMHVPLRLLAVVLVAVCPFATVVAQGTESAVAVPAPTTTGM